MMISAMLIWESTGNEISQSRMVINALVDESDGNVMNMSGVALRIDSMVVGLTSGVMDRLAGVSIETLTEGATLCAIVVLLALIVLEVVAPTRYAIDSRVGVTIDVLGATVIGATPGIAAELLLGVIANT